MDTPGDVSPPADVRWQPGGGLLFGLRRDGVYAWRPGASEFNVVATLAGSTYQRAARYGNYSRLGGESSGDLIFAGDLFGVYRQRNGRVTALKANLEIVGDLDHRHGLTVAVGLARQQQPSHGPDDIWEPYVAWLIDAEGGVRGLLPTRDGGAAMDSCYPVELSIGRFVSDDRILVIPGAERGVFLYDRDGLLRETFDAGVFSARQPDCGPYQKPLLDKEEFRAPWLFRHRVIDEVVANDQGDVFVFVRHVEDKSPATPESASRPAAEDVRHNTAELVPATASSRVAEANPATMVFGSDSLPVSELEEFWLDAAAQGAAVLITGEQAARLVAAANAQTGAGKSPASESRAFSAHRARVCWDLVHARLDDLRDVSIAPCALTSELADARLRVDLSGDRAVLLVRGATLLASGGRGRPSEVFEARLRAGR